MTYLSTAIFKLFMHFPAFSFFSKQNSSEELLVKFIEFVYQSIKKLTFPALKLALVSKINFLLKSTAVNPSIDWQRSHLSRCLAQFLSCLARILQDQKINLCKRFRSDSRCKRFRSWRYSIGKTQKHFAQSSWNFYKRLKATKIFLLFKNFALCLAVLHPPFGERKNVRFIKICWFWQY